jgi:putative peptidoglycan lipid II flippase
MSLLRSVATVGGYTMASRLAGFVRDMLIAATAGAGPVADAFFVAFKLPNFFRALFAEGAFNAAFVPLFSEILTREGRPRALAFADLALSVLLAVVLVFVTLCQIFMPTLMLGLAPGFSDEPQKFELAVLFTRITFPYLLFISLVSLLGGVLNSLGRFAAVAATPIVLNLTMIAVMLGASHLFPTPGHTLAWGVSAAGVTQFLWLVWACHRAGVLPRLPAPRLTPDVRRLLGLIGPAALGAGVVQINLVIGVMLASLLPSGAISYLFYADRLNQLPIGVVGVAVGTALLPLLSRQIAAGQGGAAHDSQNRAIELALFLGLPATAALLAVPHELIAVLFQRGAFGADATAQTAAALMAYSVGLPAYVLVRALSPGYYARKDTRTPVRFAVISIAINIGLGFALLHSLAHVGLALATAISSWANALLLGSMLLRRGHWVPDARLKDRLWRTLLATLAMAATLAATAHALDGWFTANGLQRFMALALLVGGGLAAYAIVATALGAVRLAELKAMLHRRPPPPGSPPSGSPPSASPMAD